MYGKIKLEMANKMFKEGTFSQALSELYFVNELFESYEKEDEPFEEERVKTYLLLYQSLKRLEKDK